MIKHYYNDYWIDLLDTFNIYIYLACSRVKDKYSVGLEVFKNVQNDYISILYISLYTYSPFITLRLKDDS